MEGVIRKPFQGVTNIIRFNWHFYVIAAVIIIALFIAAFLATETLSILISICIVLIVTSLFVSLAVSYYVYDRSKLYELEWLRGLSIQAGNVIVNINAGFDETSGLIATKYPQAQLHVFDFYNPQNHTEISIERARKVYAVFPGTQTVSTTSFPLQNSSVDFVFCFLAVHEIRDSEERTQFFKEAKRVLKPKGKIIVVEHIRDTANFLAYNIGFFHFVSIKEWKCNFHAAALDLKEERKITPFLSLFVLENGTTS